MSKEINFQKKVWIAAYSSYMKKKAGIPTSNDAIRVANEAVNAFNLKFKINESN